LLHNNCNKKYALSIWEFKVPKVVSHEERRSTFIEASWDVIAREGLSAATLRRVAAAAGVTTGALTHYFNDREALLVETLRTAHFAAGARMLGAMSKHANPSERLLAVLKEALPFDENRAREWKVWLAFWAQAVGNTELTTEHGRRYDEWRELLEDLVGQIVASPDKVCLGVDHLIAIVDGLGLRLTISNLDDGRCQLERQKCETLLKSMIYGLAAEQLQ
jgi:AcrR family transcriptional regulator